jgi:DNA-binding LytR/AlgR family response regulator
MKIGICDDEEYVLLLLEEYINRYSKKFGIRFGLVKFNSGEEIWDYIECDNYFDIIFLDIQMNGINGIDTAHKIRKKDTNVKIFFLTSIIKYALEGYRVKAERYFIKPLKYSRFEKELNNVIRLIEVEKNRFFIEKNDNGIFKIMLSDIVYIETIGRNTMIHTTSKNIISYRNMKQHEESLDDCFYRCHRAFIVNLTYVSSIIDNTVSLNNNEDIPLSKYRKKDFKEALLDYYGDKLG